MTALDFTSEAQAWIAERIAADPLDRVLFDKLGRERTHAITVERVNRLYLFASTRQPVTIRQGYYHLDILGLIAKTEVGYSIVVELMNEMVDAGIIDPDWIVDLSREPLIWRGYDSPAHALREAAARYFKNLWLREPHYVQVWIEKQGLIETIKSPCMRRSVSLWPAKGYASRAFLRRAVKEIVRADKPTFVYAFGDYDAAGWFASQHIDETLREQGLSIRSISSGWRCRPGRSTPLASRGRPARARNVTTKAVRSRALPRSARCSNARRRVSSASRANWTPSIPTIFAGWSRALSRGT
jgi:hypothetical protein